MNTRVLGTDRWINEQTGEVIETQTLSKEVKDVDIGFEKLWIGHIMDAIDEVGNAKIRVLFWLLHHRDKNNLVHGTVTQIAEETGAGRATVGRLMSALRKANVIRLEYGGIWRLNPSVIFKGTRAKRMNVLIRYKTLDEPELPIEIASAKAS